MSSIDSEIDELVAASATVPGWIAAEDAKVLALRCLRLPARPVLVEVGAYMGRCTALLAGSCRLRGSGRVHCIDPFDCSGDDFSVPHYEKGLRESGSDSLEIAFRQNLSRLELTPWVAIHGTTALELASRWEQPIDLLLLDADQSPAGARAAYEAWLPFLRRDGTIVLRNTLDRPYADGHDGHRRLVEEEILMPRFREIRQVGATTFAIKDF
jgi:hypothetical protein